MENNKSQSYPKIKVERLNLDYAQILLLDYSGEVSENTAVHLYIYQHLLQVEKWHEFSEALEQIAITEMHHLE